MKSMKLVLSLLLSSIIFNSCKKDAGSGPSVTGIHPTHGSYNTKDTITGFGFGAIAANDSVFFNGHRADIVSISNGQLVVTVPKLAGTGIVSVSISGKTIYGPVFTYDTTFSNVTYASGLTSPYGICIDEASGNLFVANYGNNTVVKIATDGTVSHFADGINLPGGITIDNNGNLFVTNYGNGTIAKITPAGVLATYVNVQHPAGITIDDNGTLYVTNFGDNTISIITTDKNIATIPSGIQYTTGIVRDKSGNLYLTNAAGNSISKITPSGVTTVFASGVHQPSDITIDINGNLYTTDPVDNTITKITPAGKVSIIATGLNEPDPIAVDSKGNLFVGIISTGTIAKLSMQ
jgi:YVTN family beta-propeller protein